MNPDHLKSVASAKIDESRSLLSTVSSRLWENPELALEERMAHEMLTDVLEREGFSVSRHFVLDTGFKATFASSESARPHVALMCEFDALPGIGHACGHNLIAEVAVGAGLGLKAAIESGAIGRVTVLGTPAEESVGGKIFMIKAGFFDDVDVAMMSHPYRKTVLSIHKNMLSMCALQVTFTGKASHAAGSPWEGVNALDAALTAYQSVSNLRQQMRPDWRVHGIVKEGGQRPNIIPDRAVLEYYVRCPTDSQLSVLRAKVEACFEAAAIATGCECKIELTEEPYSNMVLNAPLLDLYSGNLNTLGVPFASDSEDMGGSTDMGNVSYVVPSIHPMFAVGGEATNHSREFTRLAGAPEAQSHALAQAKALAMTGIDVLMRPEKLKECRDRFRDEVAVCKGQ